MAGLTSVLLLKTCFLIYKVSWVFITNFSDLWPLKSCRPSVCQYMFICIQEHLSSETRILLKHLISLKSYNIYILFRRERSWTQRDPRAWLCLLCWPLPGWQDLAPGSLQSSDLKVSSTSSIHGKWQGSKGIRQWPINWCSSQMMINKITPSVA